MNDNNSSSGWDVFLGLVFGLYIVISQVMTVIFYVEYVKADDIWEAITIDPILAELKSLVWPFFI